MPNFNHPDFTQFIRGGAQVKTAAVIIHRNAMSHVIVAQGQKLEKISSELAAQIQQKQLPVLSSIAFARTKVASGEVNKDTALAVTEHLKTAMRAEFEQLCAIPAGK